MSKLLVAARSVLGLCCTLSLQTACRQAETRRPPVDIPNAGAAEPEADGGGSSRHDASDGGGSDAAADGDLDDAGPGELDPARVCALAADNGTLEVPVTFGSSSGYSVTLGVTGFGVAFQAGGCGAIGTLPVGSSGPFGTPSRLLEDGCARVDDLALLRVSDGWRLAWVDNASGSSELHSALLSNALTLPADTVRAQITDNALRERVPLFADVGGVAYLAWISDDPATGRRSVERKRLDADGAVDTLLGADSGRRPEALAFAAVGRENAALAFVDERAQPGVWLQPLDARALPRGEPVRLSPYVSAGSSVDLATREADGGAVLYSIDVEGANQEVRFRRLDAKGAPVGAEMKIVAGPLQGRDASLSPLGGGYAVAFRQLPSVSEPKAQIRLTFTTKEGNPMRDGAGRLLSYPIADAAPNGGRISLRISNDGQLLVAFLDATAGGNALKLVRRRLDCAL